VIPVSKFLSRFPDHELCMSPWLPRRLHRLPLSSYSWPSSASVTRTWVCGKRGPRTIARGAQRAHIRAGIHAGGDDVPWCGSPQPRVRLPPIRFVRVDFFSIETFGVEQSEGSFNLFHGHWNFFYFFLKKLENPGQANGVKSKGKHQLHFKIVGVKLQS
jgi:hypothetical protein